MPHPNVTGRKAHVEDGPPRKRVLSVDEYGEAYGPGRTKTYELINAGLLKTITVGTRRFILVDSAEALLAQQIAETSRAA